MDTSSAIKTRRSVRAWSDQPVSDDLLAQVLEAGRYAPSPLNSQPWKLIVIKNKTTLAACAPQAQHGMFVKEAQLAIVVIIDRNAPGDVWLSEHKQQFYSGACVIQNMWLTAWELGLGACWVTLDENNTRQLLRIPENYELIGSLALGFPKAPPPPHSDHDRKPLTDIVLYESF